MIQRIQSLYMFIASVITSFIIYSPLAFITSPENNVQLYSYGVKNISTSIITTDINPILIIILTVVSAMLGLVTIFLFKKRRLQIWLNILNILILLSIPALIVYYCVYISVNLNGTVSYTINSVFPFISIILIFLSIKRIQKDEKLIRSVDRIR
jgi:hypothetical protein